MKKLSILASLVVFTLVGCKSSSTSTSTSTTNNTTEVKKEEVVKTPTETSPKKATSLRSRTLSTE
jgi:uncharacterized protein YcfL